MLLQWKLAMYGSLENSCGDSFSLTPERRNVARGVFTGFSAPTDLLEQTRQDGLSLPAIAVALRRWALQQEDVEKISVGYGGKRYSIAVLFAELQIGRISSLYGELGHVLSKFGECTSLLYPLGPAQQDSLLLNSADCYVVYAA
jgi:hypothetical protein